MCETRIKGRCGECGRSVTKILDSKKGTCRADATRYIYTGEKDAGWCIFRCKQCGEVISDKWVATSQRGDEG